VKLLNSSNFNIPRKHVSIIVSLAEAEAIISSRDSSKSFELAQKWYIYVDAQIHEASSAQSNSPFMRVWQHVPAWHQQCSKGRSEAIRTRAANHRYLSHVEQAGDVVIREPDRGHQCRQDQTDLGW
jgi:hypothetical protein